MKHDPLHISEVLSRFRADVHPKSRIAEVQNIWSTVVGSLLADKCSPVSERGGTIRVDCESSTWASEVSMMSTEIVEKLNSHLESGWAVELKCGVWNSDAQ